MSEPYDPYRYGPPPTAASAGRSATGKQVLSASWELLRQDRSLLWLPVISTLAGVIAAAIFFMPGFALGRAVVQTDRGGFYLGGLLAAFALSVVSIYFQAALVIGAYVRADGGVPTLGSVLRDTWQLRTQVLGWAVVTTTVGALIRAVEQRLGIFGRLLGFLGGIAWAIASFLAVPVLVAERVGPITAVKRSAQLIRQTWGTSVRTSLRFGVLSVLATFAALVVAIIAVVAGFGVAPAVGVVVLCLVIIGFVIGGSIMGAVITYARALIYRYATGRPVPGIAPYLLAGTFVQKRRRRGRGK